MSKHIIYTTKVDIDSHIIDDHISWDMDQHKLVIASYYELFEIVRRITTKRTVGSQVEGHQLQIQEVIDISSRQFRLELTLSTSNDNDFLFLELLDELKNTLRNGISEAATAMLYLNSNQHPEKVKIIQSDKPFANDDSNIIPVKSETGKEIVQALRANKNIHHPLTLITADSSEVNIPLPPQSSLKFTDSSEALDIDVFIHAISSSLFADIFAVTASEKRKRLTKLRFQEDDKSQLGHAFADGLALNLTVKENIKISFGNEFLDSYDIISVNSTYAHKKYQPPLC